MKRSIRISMATWVTPLSAHRVPTRMGLWGWATRSVPLAFTRNAAISTPYVETTPMVALREYPVPETQLDSSIFEASEEDEYRSVAESFKHPITPVATNSSGFSSSSLLQLVRKGSYDSASYMRAEMIQHNVPITPHHAFTLAAIRAISSIADPAVRLREFSGWLSLLPVAREGAKSRPMFGRLTHILSHNPQPDIDLVMAFVRICVSKGYMIKIPDQMIPLVVRLAPPSVSLQFLEDLRSLAVEKSPPGEQLNRKIRFWCKTAMVEYLGVGLTEEATKIFQMGLEYGVSLPRVPSRWLRKAVAKVPGHLGLSEEAFAALNRPKVRLPRHKGPSRRPGLISEIPPAVSPLNFDTDTPGPKALLLRVWENTRAVKPPDPLDVARFLETFDSQPAIVRFLSACNQNKPPRYRGQWILGEMLYYARRKEWKELIGAFDTYFFRVGVPGNIDEHKLRGSATARNVQQRLFPSPHHTGLVWMAAVEMAQGARPISALFKEMVGQATAAKTRDYARVGPSLVSTSTEIFDAGHFNPFLIAAYRARRFKRLVVAVGQMSRLGIKPDPEQLSLLAGAHAARADGHEAARVLDRIGDALKKKGGVNRSSRGHYNVSKIVALYLPALKWFIARKNTPGTSLVRSRVLGQGYVRGTNSCLDQMLAKLEAPTEVSK